MHAYKVYSFVVLCFNELMLKSDLIYPLYLIFTGFRFLHGDTESLVTPQCIPHRLSGFWIKIKYSSRSSATYKLMAHPNGGKGEGECIQL